MNTMTETPQEVLMYCSDCRKLTGHKFQEMWTTENDHVRACYSCEDCGQWAFPFVRTED